MKEAWNKVIHIIIIYKNCWNLDAIFFPFWENQVPVKSKSLYDVKGTICIAFSMCANFWFFQNIFVRIWTCTYELVHTKMKMYFKRIFENTK